MKNLFHLVLIAMAALPMAMTAQFEGSQWHFGNGIGLDFSTGNPTVVESDINVASMVTPASICDATGNLVAYTDGTEVYNADHEVVNNSEFSNIANESLIVPNPYEDAQYYVFRSGSWGIDYSILDFGSNADGDMPDDTKEIEIYAYESELMTATKPFGGLWLVTADNVNGGVGDVVHVNVFSIGATEITFVDEYEENYLWAGWYEALDDAAMSPDCSKMAFSFKGHYIAFAEFDNEDGTVFNFLLSLNNNGSFVNVTELEFGPSSQYLYSLADYNTIKQYNVESWNISDIEASVANISTNGSPSWQDIKLAQNGKLYVLDDGENDLDVVNEPGEPADAVEFEDDVVGLTGVTTYFPNTPNLSCQNIVDLAIFHQYECLGDLTELWYSFSTQPDSVYWDFGDPSTGALNNSTEDEPIHIFSAPGDYVVTLTTWIDALETISQHPLTIYDQPDANLGPDETICAGVDDELSSGDPGFDYLWSTDETTESILLSETGTYWVEISNVVCFDSDTVEIEVIPIVTVDVTEDIFLCNDEPVELWATMSGQTEFIWNNGVEAEVIFVDESGEYWMTAWNECFTVSDSVTVTLISLPTILLPGDFEACLGDSIELISAYTNGNILWSTQETTPSIEITSTGTYSVFIDYMGCTTEDEVFVEFFPFVEMDDVIMPNVFSPDYVDNWNTTFRPFLAIDPELDFCSYETIDINLQVYDRWGNEITSGACSWDGRNPRGNPVAESVYYYIIDLHSTCLDREERDQKAGHLTLLRTWR